VIERTANYERAITDCQFLNLLQYLAKVFNSNLHAARMRKRLFVSERLLRKLRLGMILVQMAESSYLGRHAEVFHGDFATQIRTEVETGFNTKTAELLLWLCSKESNVKTNWAILGSIGFSWKSDFT